MKGYCSNSPQRCSHAMSCKIVESDNDLCPKCQMALITTKQEAHDIVAIKGMLTKSIILMILVVTLTLFFYLRS